MLYISDFETKNKTVELHCPRCKAVKTYKIDFFAGGLKKIVCHKCDLHYEVYLYKKNDTAIFKLPIFELSKLHTE